MVSASIPASLRCANSSRLQQRSSATTMQSQNSSRLTSANIMSQSLAQSPITNPALVQRANPNRMSGRVAMPRIVNNSASAKVV